MNKIEKISKKAGLSTQATIDIIVTEHTLKHFYKSKELTTLNINLEGKSREYIEKICKHLSVSPDAVIAYTLSLHMGKNEIGNH